MLSAKGSPDNGSGRNESNASMGTVSGSFSTYARFGLFGSYSTSRKEPSGHRFSASSRKLRIAPVWICATSFPSIKSPLLCCPKPDGALRFHNGSEASLDRTEPPVRFIFHGRRGCIVQKRIPRCPPLRFRDTHAPLPFSNADPANTQRASAAMPFPFFLL